MNAPGPQLKTPTEMSPAMRAHFLEMLADLGVFEFEIRHEEGVRVAATGDGFHNWSVNDRQQIDLSPVEFGALLAFVDESGQTPITLVQRDDTREVEIVKDRSDAAGRTAHVRFIEHVTLKVLSLVIGENQHEALLHIEGAGEYRS